MTRPALMRDALLTVTPEEFACIAMLADFHSLPSTSRF